MGTQARRLAVAGVVAKSTYYVRDVQGNPLAIYDVAGSVITLKEQQLYGSSRLGTWSPNLNLTAGTTTSTDLAYNVVGQKYYELTNHLGNVMATISDKRLQTGSSTPYYLPDVITQQDYYSFGAPQPGDRTYVYLNHNAYRYGFNGKENDDDVGKGVGNQQDYGMRISDPRVGRFFSVDPLTAKYPELTPYQFASNRPIQGIDLDGLEFKNKSYYSLSLQTSTVFGTTTSKQIVEYHRQNRPSYLIINNMVPEPARPEGYDQSKSINYIMDPNEIRPNYKAFEKFAQASRTELKGGEMKTYRLGSQNRDVDYKAGGVNAQLSLFKEVAKWVDAGESLFSEKNSALNEAFQDKVTFYNSINLVNNFATERNLNIPIKMKTDLVNWVNTGAVPYNLLDPKSHEGLTFDQAVEYNQAISTIGKEIYDSRKGQGNAGRTSMDPQNKDAIPYR